MIKISLYTTKPKTVLNFNNDALTNKRFFTVVSTVLPTASAKITK